jgi:Cryptococcal mannosyltransferase 1
MATERTTNCFFAILIQDILGCALPLSRMKNPLCRQLWGDHYILLLANWFPSLPCKSWSRLQYRLGVLLVIGIVFYTLPLPYIPSGKAVVNLAPDYWNHTSLLLPPAFGIHHPPAPLAAENSTLLGEIQHAAFTLIGYPRPTCPIHDWHRERYQSLLDSRKTLFLAINLHNNANVAPNIMQELPVLLRFLGPHNVHISIYESGSFDETPRFLVLREFHGIHTFSCHLASIDIQLCCGSRTSTGCVRNFIRHHIPRSTGDFR